MRTKLAPPIVALHDHGGFYLWGKEKIVEMPNEHPVLSDFKRECYGGRSIATELVRQGYVVAVIDMFYWGERRMLLDDDPADWRERPATISQQRISAFNQRARQKEAVGRADDFLSRIHVAGIDVLGRYSVGGLFGDAAGGGPRTGLDAWDCPSEDCGRAISRRWTIESRRRWWWDGWRRSRRSSRSDIRNTIGHTKVVPGLYRYLDYPDVASLAMPNALMVINGRKDGLFDLEGVKASFEKLNACYTKAGMPGQWRPRWYDTPHEFNGAMQVEAWDWLKRFV